jgi:outer membrane protein TolC
MKRIRPLILSAALTFSLTATPASPAQAQIYDLRGAERVALERNLDLRAIGYSLRASESRLRGGYGLYDPVAEVRFAEGEARDRSNLYFLADQTTVKERYRQFDLSLSQKLPTGADLVASWTNGRQDSTPPTAINPAYQSELRFSLTQPLLRGFGSTVTEQVILFAAKDRDVALEDLREQAFALLAQVRDGYFEVLSLRDNLVYRETSVDLAEKVFSENRARVDAGVMAPVEILEAEVGLSQRQRELLDARRAYEDALDNLALLLNSGEAIEVSAAILDQPPLETDEERGLASALILRPDLLRRMREIERLDLEARINRNALLPTLDLDASYSHKGLAGNYNDNLSDLGTDELRNWQLGLTLSYPLGNRSARNDYRRSQQLIQGSRAQLEGLRDQIRNEIRAAIRLVEVSRKKIEVSGRGHALAEEKLRTLFKRREVGLATTRQVLEGEEDLALARTDQIASLADYNRAVTAYLRVTGLLLEHEGVSLRNGGASDDQGSLLHMAGE